MTCRCWNWRQARLTQLTPHTTIALFILDALDPLTDEQVHAAVADLVAHLRATSPDLQVAQRLISAPPPPDDKD